MWSADPINRPSGDDDQAVKTRTRSEEINAEQLGGPHPADIAFLAMAHHRLVHAEEAKKLLDQLRQSLKDERWKNDGESQALLREAEQLHIILAPSRKDAKQERN